MSNQATKAEAFRALHVPGKPVILFNIWDAGSAKAVASAGAKALATGSWSVAAANGFPDGEKVPRDIAIDNLLRIVKATDLPVTVDVESGYGKTPAEVGETIRLAIIAGAIGCNLEDSFPEDGKLRPLAESIARVRAARQAADTAKVPFFINARTDVFFQDEADKHDGAMVDAALERGRAYAEAGASGLFVPGLVNIALIRRVAAASPLPVNIMMGGKSPSIAELAQNGVARVSHGPGPYRLAMKAVEDAARGVLA